MKVLSVFIIMTNALFDKYASQSCYSTILKHYHAKPLIYNQYTMLAFRDTATLCQGVRYTRSNSLALWSFVYLQYVSAVFIMSCLA